MPTNMFCEPDLFAPPDKLKGEETLQQLADCFRLQTQIAQQCMFRLRQAEFERKQAIWINAQLRRHYQEQYANAWFTLRVLLLATALVAGLTLLYRHALIPDGWQWLAPTALLLPFAVAALTGKDFFERRRLRCGWQWLLLLARPAARQTVHLQLQQQYKALYRAQYDDQYYARE